MGARPPLIRTRDDLLELIAHVLRLQLSYLSKDQALAVAAPSCAPSRPRDPAAQMMPAARGSSVMENMKRQADSRRLAVFRGSLLRPQGDEATIYADKAYDRRRIATALQLIARQGLF